MGEHITLDWAQTQKKKVHRRLEQGQTASEEYTGVASTCRNGARKAKAFKVETSKGDE